MKAKLLMLVSAATLAILMGAGHALAGQVSVGVSVGHSGYPVSGYFSYYSGPPPVAYVPYGPPVLYPVPVVRPCYYAPYGYRVEPVYRPYYLKPYRGRGHGAYVPRRYRRH